MLFDERERGQIEQAVAAIEAQSAAEVVVVVLERAADYAAPRALLSALLAVAASYCLHGTALSEALHWRELVALQAVAGLLVWVLLGWPPLLRLWLPRRLVAAAAQEKAYAIFAQRGVHRTRDASGILLLLTAAEHQAVWLADHGVHAQLGEHGWQGYLTPIIEGLKARRGAAAICEQLRLLQSALAEHFPRRDDDRNELPDRVH